MKKVLTILAFITVCFSSSCISKESAPTIYEQSDDDYYQYELNETIISYDIDDIGNLYYVTEEIIGYGTYLVNGKEQELPKTETYINILNSEGILINSYAAPEVIII